MDDTKYIDIVFDGPPSHDPPRFVEVENDKGEGIKAGEWLKQPEFDDTTEGRFWRLRIPCQTSFDMDNFAAQIHYISTGKGFTPPGVKNLPEKLLLSVSELVEAMEEHRSGKRLVYFKCGVCGLERDHAEAEHEGHYIPNVGLVKKVMSFFNLMPKSIPCEGKVLKPEGVLVEIADSTIRNLHMMYSLIAEYNKVAPSPFPYRVSDIHEIKVDFNSGRPPMHGGRKY